MFFVRPSTPSSVANHRNPRSAAISSAWSETEPSDGHSPAGGVPKLRSWMLCAPSQAAPAHLPDNGKPAEAEAYADSTPGRYPNRTAAAGSGGSTAWSKFRSARARPPAVLRQDRRQQLMLLRQQNRFVFFGEVRALFGQRPYRRVFGKILFVHPRQLRQHLQIAPISRTPVRHAGLRAARARLRFQLPESRPPRTRFSFT